MSPICFLSVSVTDSCAKPILGKIKYHTSKLADAARAGKLGREARELAAIRITVAESPNARASYEAPLW